MKFKVVHNVRLFTSYSVDSNLQDKIAGRDGVRKWKFCKFDRRSQEIVNNKDSKQKYIWGIVKQIQHGLFREVVKITGPRCWMRETTSLRFTSGSIVSRIQHLGTSNFYYFPQYHVVFCIILHKPCQLVGYHSWQVSIEIKPSNIIIII